MVEECSGAPFDSPLLVSTSTTTSTSSIQDTVDTLPMGLGVSPQSYDAL
jgi:hypothetical protein